MKSWYLLFAVNMGKEQSKLKPRDLYELTRATTFSERKIKVYRQEFKKRSKSGTMTPSELKMLYLCFFPDGDPSNFAEHTFRTFDQNVDGVLDFYKLIVAIAILKKGDVNERLKLAFDIYYIDGNGYITRNELLGILMAFEELIFHKNDGTFATVMASQIIERVDTNSDGKILGRWEEFNNVAAKVDIDLAAMLDRI